MSTQNTKMFLTALVLIGVSFMSTACLEFKLGGMTTYEAFPDEKVARLVEAASRGNPEEVDASIRAGADVNAVGAHGVSPLIWVLATRNKIGAERLLKAGANPNYIVPSTEPTKKLANESAMSLAAGGNDLELLELLLKHGGDPNLRGPDDRPLLHIAVFQYRWDNLRLLLKYGADINIHTSDGSTAADVTVSLAHFDQAAFLLEKGFNYDLQEFAKGVEIVQVPRNSEQYQWKQKVIEMLKERGVKFPAFVPKKASPSPRQ